MRIIICGPGASGKDLLKARFVGRGFRPAISYTSRPPRNGEKDGREYWFVSDHEFNRMIDDDMFVEWQIFPTKIGGVYVNAKYGTERASFMQNDVFIMTPKGIADLDDRVRAESIVIYLDIPEETRRRRLSGRIGGDDVEVRLASDRDTFNGFSDYDLRITNPDF